MEKNSQNKNYNYLKYGHSSKFSYGNYLSLLSSGLHCFKTKLYFPKMLKPLTYICLHQRFTKKFTKKVKQDVHNILVCSMNLVQNKFIFYSKK